MIAHSLGGVVAKHLVVQLERKADTRPIVDQLQGMLFIATPHDGSHVANIASHTSWLVGQDVLYLQRRRAWGELEELHQQFLASVGTARDRRPATGAGARPPRLRGMYETLETKGVLVVPRSSALRGMDNENNDPFAAVDGDHFACCKPEAPSDPAYVRMEEYVRALLTEAPPPSTSTDPPSTSTKGPSTSTKPLPPVPRPRRRSRAVGVGAVVATLAIVVGAMGVWRHEMRAWIQSRPIRLAAVAHQDEHALTRDWEISRFAHDGDPLHPARTLGDVLVEANSQVRQLRECLQESTGSRADCVGVTIIVAPGGTGKGPVGRHLAVTLAGATRIDLAWPRDAGAAFDSLGGTYEPYSTVPGVLAASLPAPQFDRVRWPHARDGAADRATDASELNVPGSAPTDAARDTGSGALAARFSAVIDFYGQNAPAHERGFIRANPRTVIVDSLDEISASSGRAILELATAWTAEDDERAVVFLSRAEAAIPLVRTHGDTRAIGIARLDPLFVGSGETFLWYLTDVACTAHLRGVPLPSSAQGRMTCAEHESWADRRAWAVDAAAGLGLDGARDLLYAGETGNIVIQAAFDGSDRIPTAVLTRLLQRAREHHGRPQPGDRLFAPYFSALSTLAHEGIPRGAGMTRADVLVGMGAVRFSVGSQSYEIREADLLRFSGFVAYHGDGFEFHPPALQAVLASAELRDGQVVVDEARYGAAMACVLPGCPLGL
ncbi:hypothetical protein [Sandaracinus amylolyticus]|nr:hypothetical protein [Sandaracinus amylolyticus]